MDVDARELDAATLAARRRRPPGRVLRLADRIARQLVALRQRGVTPERDGFGHPVERARRDVAHRDHDGHVTGPEGLQLLPLVRPHENVERARHHRERRLQLVRSRYGVRHRHGDDHVRAGLARDVHRDVARQAAVAQHAPVERHGREDAWHRHAGTQRMRQAPLREHDHLARLHVGRDRTKRNWQAVEFAHAEAARHEQADGLLDVLRIDETAGRRQPAVAHAELEAVAVDVSGQLAPHRQLRALSLESERLLEGDAANSLVDLACGHAGCVGPTDQRAHAGADHAIDRDTQLLEHREHADVRAALGAASAQHQPDAWPARRGRRAHPPGRGPRSRPQRQQRASRLRRPPDRRAGAAVVRKSNAPGSCSGRVLRAGIGTRQQRES